MSLLLRFYRTMELRTDHQNEDSQDDEDDGVPVLRQELLQRRDALLRQQQLTQSGERSGWIDL